MQKDFWQFTFRAHYFEHYPKIQKKLSTKFWQNKKFAEDITELEVNAYIEHAASTNDEGESDSESEME